MKKIVPNLWEKANIPIISGLVLFNTSRAIADIPDAGEPSDGDGDNYVQTFGNYGKDAFDIMFLFIGAAMFLVGAYVLIKSLYETVNSPNRDWGGFMVTAVVTGLVMAVGVLLVNLGQGVLTTGPAA
ncbi:TIGR03745 family integrating conjugative element membrane protein [Endozoicomonas sp. SM1973]|uniref:TIGR03745 family integrating conjugative element membrane protein n=1 Tax=Spartinivicinus marinus TaxID=2994442 RepID=A0A853IF91_9GAMM|nr:TIGR03745 family integrating conjugative element membrane protein [Spartinivicinus marinus]MCX4030182.1 TIGR03745 family integrating conjugative element membrane protein [Spartinivicinus marinus]NYZ67825.1 TIGR03745 family integrating conjugative element membrane protein [Spartinivicinus marinus]